MRLPADLDARSLSDLKALVIALVVKVTELERTVAAQRDEIARLKGLKGRPQIKPSGMEKASQAPTQERAAGKRRRKRTKSADLTIHEERIIKARPVPPGSRFSCCPAQSHSPAARHSCSAPAPEPAACSRTGSRQSQSCPGSSHPGSAPDECAAQSAAARGPAAQVRSSGADSRCGRPLRPRTAEPACRTRARRWAASAP